MNLVNTLPALETPTRGLDAMKFTYTSGDRPLEGYTIKRGIGHGGFGEVYYAVSDGGKEVALKLVQRNLEVELRGVGQCLNVKHQNLVTLYDVKQEEGGECWVVMEYMSGTSLDALIDEHPTGISPDEAVRWLRGIAAGVDYLHERGIVHRDLKPGNLFVEDGQVKIGDYGLAKFVSVSRRSGNTESVGTVHYMAPELAQGRYSKEIDLYAIGVIFYEMLTGHVPFEGESVGEILMKHLTAQPDLSRVPEPYRQVVARLLAKDPSQRYASARAMLADLGEPGTASSSSSFAAKQPQTKPESAETVAHPHRRPFRDLVHRRRNLAQPLSKSHRKSANCIGVGVGFLLAAWAMAGGVPEAMVFLGVGGGLVAGALARYLPFAAKSTTSESNRMAGLLGTSLGMLAFGWALAGGVFDVAPFLGIGTGLLAGGLLPNLRVFDFFVGGPSQKTDSVGTLLGAGIGILVFGGAIAGGCEAGALFLGIGAGMLSSIVITALLRLEGAPVTAQSLEAPGTASVDPGAPTQPSHVPQDYYLATANQQVEGVAHAAAEASPKPFRPIRKILKFFVWTVVLGFVFVLFASILTVIGAWMLFSPTIHANAEGVQEMTRGITAINIPEGLEPQFAAGEKLLGTKLAVYADPDKHGEERFLLLMAFPHGKQHLPASVQEFLEEELAVVRPARMSRTIHGDSPVNPENLPDLPAISLDAEALELEGISNDSAKAATLIAKEVQEQVHLEIHRELRDLKYVMPKSGGIELLDGFASENDIQRPYVIRGEEQTVTIRRGRKQKEQVVRVFVPFEAKGEKPALLVFGTPEEQWEDGDSEKFELMLESMN